MPTPEPTAVPLLIGVTGHRQIDPAIVPALREAMRGVFRHLQRELPNTPLVLMSPLATGADQIAAEVAVEPGMDVRVVAVLPWPRELNATIGVASKERGGCERLLSQATQVVSMPLANGVSEGGLRTDERQRQTQYDQCGRYIARHGQVLIAVWDEVAPPESDTRKVIRYHAEGAPAPFTARVGALDTTEQAAVCTLKVSRKGSATATTSTQVASPDEAILPEWYYPKVQHPPVNRKPPQKFGPRVAYRIRRVLLSLHHWMHVIGRWSHGPTPDGRGLLWQRWRAMDRFNRDIVRLAATDAEALDQNRGYLIPHAESAQLPPCVQQLREIYALADTVAGRWQSRTWRTVLALFLVGLLAVASLELFAHYEESWEAVVPRAWWLASYLVLLGAGYGLFRWTQRLEHQGRWLDYRALAEALRVQVFWRAAGLTDCVADHYLRHFRGELDWIRQAARAAYLMAGGHAVEHVASRDEALRRLRVVHTCWAVDQEKYFRGKGPHNAEIAISFETLARLAFWSAVGIAAYQGVELYWQQSGEHSAHIHVSHLLVLGTFGCLVAAAMFDEFAETHAYALLARRYSWMADLYRNAEHRLGELLEEAARQGADSPEEQTPFDRQADRVRRLLFELGLEALAENADWVVQHRERPPTLPSG